MPSQPWASDLERLRRDLTQRLDRMETSATAASRDAARDDPSRRLQDLDRRTADLQTRLTALERIVNQIKSQQEVMLRQVNGIGRIVETIGRT